MPRETFITRPLSLDDAQKFVDIANAIASDAGENHTYHADFILAEWQEPNFDILKSSYGILTDEHMLVGYVILWDTHDIPVHPRVEWGVHPDYWEHNLSPQLLDWADKTSRRIIDRCPPDVRLSLHTSVLNGCAPMERVIKQTGYTPIRLSYTMRIDMETPPNLPNPPNDFIIRTYKNTEGLPAFVSAFQDSFSDHFGYVPRSFDKVLEEFEHWFATDAIDPELVFFAIDAKSGEIAGYVLGMKEEGNTAKGYIDLVGVRPQYRRRGLAQALLLNTLHAYWNRGTTCVTLDVDGKSLTNAVILYERVGMVIESQYTRYEKVIRDGIELATVQVE